MRTAYKRYKSKDPHHQYIFRAELLVKFINGSRSISASCLIDSGADGILINKEWAKALGIDWQFGTSGSAGGIVGTSVPIFYHDIEMEVEGLPQSLAKVNVGFIDSPNVGILLGQIGFFDNFKVSFERYNNFFEVDLKP